MRDLSARVRANLAEIHGRIADAATRAGRSPDSVKLLPVTKYVGVEEIRVLVAAGCTELGESRPQHLWEKAELLRDLPIRWHLIGHLQRNKVRRTLPLLSMIHSVDSPRLVAALDETAGELDGKRGQSPFAGTARRVLRTNGDCPLFPARPLPILLEVNVSGEPAKHGFAPGEVERFLASPPDCRNLQVCGLMCMAALEGGLEVARRDFAALRGLRDRVQANCPEGVRLDELSMGMSGDYEIAVEEGATIVRIGSALFAGAT
jgi:PLP dependent protein